jgi:hypothetical protein
MRSSSGSNATIISRPPFWNDLLQPVSAGRRCLSGCDECNECCPGGRCTTSVRGESRQSLVSVIGFHQPNLPFLRLHCTKTDAQNGNGRSFVLEAIKASRQNRVEPDQTYVISPYSGRRSAIKSCQEERAESAPWRLGRFRPHQWMESREEEKQFEYEA